MITIREMNYFLTIVQEGNISNAAQKLHIAQPPLSRSIKQLEETLRCQLFKRGSRQIELTEAGKLFQHRAEQMLKLMDTTISEVKDLQDGNHGTLSIGIASTSGITILPVVANIFHQQYPNLKFELWNDESIRIVELIRTGIVEIGLVRFSFDTDAFNVIQLPKDPLVAALHTNIIESFPKTKYLSLKQLAERPLMIHRKYETTLTEHCQKVGFNPNYLCQSDDILPLLAWADAGVGIAVVPQAAVGMIPTPNILFRTIVDPIVELNTVLIWKRNQILSPAGQKFLDIFMTLRAV